MKKEMQVLGLIMARGGSKSIPKKNIHPCAGRPLIEYTIDAALHAKGIDRLIISTDNEEIAEIARKRGVEVPFMRPAEISQDTTLDFPVMVHALEWFKQNEGVIPQIVLHLRPTTPLKSATDITKGIELLMNNPDADSVRSICKPLHTPFKMYRLDESEKYIIPILRKEYPEIYEKFKEPHNSPRQALPVIWRHSGYVDIVRSKVVLEDGLVSGTRILPLFFETWRDVDIDSMDDLKEAEKIINRLKEDGKEPWE